MPVVICNRFHERLANNGKINFCGGTTIWWSRAQVSLNLENQDLDHQNLHSMLKNSYAACLCLPQSISAQFALEMCLTARNRQKIHVQWSSMVTEFGANREPVYDFLLVISSNLGPISHHFWDTATYWLKVANVPYPLSLSTPTRYDPFQIYRKALRTLKLKSSRQPMVKIWWS